MDTTNAFAVPRQLFACRGRHGASDNNDSGAFFTADEYALFSLRGDVHKSRLYEELETRRQIVLTPVNASKCASRCASKRSRKIENKHLHTKNMVQLLVEAIESHQIQAPENMLELDNARRRVSNFSVVQHEQYLKLQHKLYQALQRGLPEVLALSEDEAKQWHKTKSEIEKEQVSFCRTMARGLAAEAAINETQVPAMAEAWYNGMLAQCWNDIYRLYPRYFEPCVAIKLATGDREKSGIAPLNAKEVAARGTCCTIDLRQFVASQPLWSHAEDSEEVSMNVVSPRQAISADVQAHQLMEKYDCDIAISSSTLITLFDSDTSTHFGHVPAGWGILLKSQASIGENSKATKKRIFVDRPLPGNAIGTREKVAEAGRAALLSYFETESMIEGSTGGRTSYHVWQLNEKRILVRSTIHASAIKSTLSEIEQLDESSKKQTAAPLCVFVKPDYQSLGIEEQLTTSERCRFWLHSWLRGGADVLVARVNPLNDLITSWKTYSPASLIYGDSAQQLPLEAVDPSLKFQWLSTLFNTLSDLPEGTYLLRSLDDSGPSTFGKRRGGVEVLVAGTDPDPNLGVVDLYTFMPKLAISGTSPVSIPFDVAASALPSWNLPDRIPYTFQTGMCCLSFFVDGVCSTLSMGKSCDYAHLRLPEQKKSSMRRPARAKRWRFENYTKVLSGTTCSNMKALDQPVSVKVNFAFCGEDTTPPTVSDIADVYAPVHCNKQSIECSRPHLTLHQIIDRLADDLLRKGREKRRAQKNENRQQHKKARK